MVSSQDEEVALVLDNGAKHSNRSINHTLSGNWRIIGTGSELQIGVERGGRKAPRNIGTNPPIQRAAIAIEIPRGQMPSEKGGSCVWTQPSTTNATANAALTRPARSAPDTRQTTKVRASRNAAIQ